MGTCCSLIKSHFAEIPRHQRKEFLHRINELFYRSGMLDWDEYILFGEKYLVLKRARPHKHLISFNYNYFEDDFHEEAGLNMIDYRLWSGKVDSGNFTLAMLAAYSLEGLYTEEPTTIEYDGSWLYSDMPTSWINYVFDEKFTARGKDPWEVYLKIRGSHIDKYLVENNLSMYKNGVIGYRGYLDIIAVKYGLEQLSKILVEELPNENDVNYRFRKDLHGYYLYLYNYIKEFKNKSSLDSGEQIKQLISMLREFYSADDSIEIIKNKEDKEIRKFLVYLVCFDCPAATIKIIADIYKTDFWKLWELVADVARRRTFNEESYTEVYYTSTEEYFNISTDDLVLYWTKEKPLTFSEEMKKWLANLQEDYNAVLAKGVDMTSPLRRLKEMLDFAEEHYVNIYLFEELMNDTFENITNPKFVALWMVFEKVLHDPENLNAAKVLFGPNRWHKDEGDNVQIGHRVCDTWWAVSNKQKFNSGRQNVRRYIALMANRDFRREIFGI